MSISTRNIRKILIPKNLQNLRKRKKSSKNFANFTNRLTRPNSKSTLRTTKR